MVYCTSWLPTIVAQILLNHFDGAAHLPVVRYVELDEVEPIRTSRLQIHRPFTLHGQAPGKHGITQLIQTDRQAMPEAAIASWE